MKHILEPVLSHWRMLKVKRYLKKYSNPTILDIGCGERCFLLNRIKNIIDKGYGIDRRITSKSYQNITLFNVDIEYGIPMHNDELDVITMLAVLEHLNNPLIVLSEIERVLKPGGMLIMTVPSVWSKPVLEFLSFKIGIIDPELLIEHKTYYNKNSLSKLLLNVEGLYIERHRYFQFFMNNLVIVKKQLTH